MTNNGDVNVNDPIATEDNQTTLQKTLMAVDAAATTEAVMEMKSMLAELLKKSDAQDKLNSAVTDKLRALETMSITRETTRQAVRRAGL